MVALALFTVGCGESTDTATPSTTTATPTTTVAPTTTATPTTTVAPTTTATPTTTVAPTTTAAPTTTVAPTTTAAPTAVTQPVGLAALCSFDQDMRKVSCYASGVTQGSQLQWESNVSGWRTGPSYEVKLVEAWQLVPQVLVMLQECRGSDCQTVEALLDTSSIVSVAGQGTASDSQSSNPDTPTTTADLVRERWAERPCEGTGSQRLSVSPISPELLDYIKPLGHVTGNHITPTSHQKWFPLADSAVDVRAPTSGRIIWLTNRGTANSGESFGGFAGQDYEVQYVIEVSCDFYLIIDHVLGVPESIAQALGTSWDARVHLPVSAGELLGQHSDGSKIDIGVIDLTLGEITGLIRKESYYDGQDGEAFKLFERDSFDYFDEPLRSQLAEKSLRLSAPRGGLFAYDINGTAQGNWFEDGTNGYMGTGSGSFGAYWSGHLALVPDSQEPSKLRVSMGDGFVTAGMPSIWGVTGDSPRFETVTASSGLITYELRRLLPCDGSDINVKGRAREFLCNQESAGILLIELIDDWTMRVEVFFQIGSADGLDFSGNARTYAR